jgi:hypothetical protein
MYSLNDPIPQTISLFLDSFYEESCRENKMIKAVELS